MSDWVKTRRRQSNRRIEPRGTLDFGLQRGRFFNGSMMRYRAGLQLRDRNWFVPLTAEFQMRDRGYVPRLAAPLTAVGVDRACSAGRCFTGKHLQITQLRFSS